MKAVLFSLFILPSVKVGNEVGSSSESFPHLKFEKSKSVEELSVRVHYFFHSPYLKWV